MNGDEAVRAALQEMLLDDVALPSEAVRDAMLTRTFASEPGAGSDLLPPDGLFDDPASDDGLDEAVPYTETETETSDGDFADGHVDVDLPADDVHPGQEPAGVDHDPDDAPDPGDQSW